MFQALFTTALLSLSLPASFALPATNNPPIPLNGVLRRSPSVGEITPELLASYRTAVEHKYNPSAFSKRQTSGASALVNYNLDGSYFTALSVGTPPTKYNVVLDTGSSDFWLISSACTSCTQAGITAPRFNPSASSTFSTATAKPFAIQFVGGTVNGSTAADTVSLAGHTVTGQAFGIVNSYSGSVLPDATSGLMGMAFRPLAQIATPFWEQSIQQPPGWVQPLFAFALSRQINNPRPRQEAPGGSFTMGAVDPAVFTGEIDYTPLISTGWWMIPLAQITVQGSTIELGGQAAAIDTGTTLIGGPQNVIDAIYANIPNAQAGTGATRGFYFLPCDTNVQISLTFGAKTWPMNPVDLGRPTSSSGLCTGSFFSGNFGNSPSAPRWIIGDAFLKNVYTVFRADPASVGFAALSNPAALQSGEQGVPASLPSGGGAAFPTQFMTVGPITGGGTASQFAPAPTGALPNAATRTGSSRLSLLTAMIVVASLWAVL